MTITMLTSFTYEELFPNPNVCFTNLHPSVYKEEGTYSRWGWGVRPVAMESVC